MAAFSRVVFVLALLSPSSSSAQAVDPSAHWVGAIDTPEMSMAIEIDLGKGTNGQFVATFAQPQQGVKGLPFSSVTVDGRAVRLVLKAGPENSTFEGTLSPDGNELSGTASQAGMSAPFKLTRHGAARIVQAPKSAPIAKELEGTWSGALDVGGRQQRLIVTLTNHADGSSTGTVMSPDGSGVAIPAAITQGEATVTIDVPSVGAGFVGMLNGSGGELTGTWTQAQVTLPLTLKRTAH
jgi:hypothetical protein